MVKVIFRHSHSYDKLYKDIYGYKNYPTEKEIVSYIKNIQKIWAKLENKILKELENVSKLRFKEGKIICYVIGKAIPFSDPLTIPIYKEEPNYFIDTLIHELIHILFTQEGNLNKAKKLWRYIFRKYKNETFETKIHIPLHAVHTHIYTVFFSMERLEHDIIELFNLRAYRRSWEIVNKDGYQNIINEFTKRI